MLCLTVQPHNVCTILEDRDYVNTYKYKSEDAEYRFAEQFKYEPIFAIPVVTALSAYCYLLINQVRFGRDIILFNTDEYFEVSMDEWHAMRRGDKKKIAQIQSPIKETVVSCIHKRDIHYIRNIPYYSNDIYYNYLLHCLSGSPYYDLCNFLNETPLKIDSRMSDILADVLMSPKYEPLLTTMEVRSPVLFREFTENISDVLMKG